MRERPNAEVDLGEVDLVVCSLSPDAPPALGADARKEGLRPCARKAVNRQTGYDYPSQNFDRVVMWCFRPEKPPPEPLAAATWLTPSSAPQSRASCQSCRRSAAPRVLRRRMTAAAAAGESMSCKRTGLLQPSSTAAADPAVEVGPPALLGASKARAL